MLQNYFRWLLFFYTVPAKPANLRMKVWRRLLRLGAVSLKGSIYLLPYSEDHVEALHWLANEVAGLQGEAGFVKAGGIETMSDDEIVALFNTQREHDYHPIEAVLEAIAGQVDSLSQQVTSPGMNRIMANFQKASKELRTVQAIDFFHAPGGAALQVRLEDLEEKIRKLAGSREATPSTPTGVRKKEDFQDRVWLTRQNPFVDRMASAWLIRRFIDPGCRFEFVESERLPADHKVVSFDLPGGDFSHEQDRCTFEVLVEAFGLRGKALRKLAEVVHELDLKDGKFPTPLATGVESVLVGLRKTAADDREALEEGIKVFERLYAALSK